MAVTWFDRTTAQPIHLSLAAGTLTLSFAGHSNLSFDGEGRLIGAWFDGITYRRSLGNSVQKKWLGPSQGTARPVRHREMLDDEERRLVLERAYDSADSVTTGLACGGIDIGATEPRLLATVTAWLSRLQIWNWPRLEREAVRFRTVYQPISILPPDQYLALVLQATEGCSYNECSFCTFYRDRPFRIKNPDDFVDHLSAVQDFFGRGLHVRKTLFLADANAVIIPQTRLLPLLHAANRSFPVLPQTLTPAQKREWQTAHDWYLDGIYAFISAPDAQRKRADDFAVMREQNVRRLYIGVETGLDSLREFLQKPGAAADVCAAVEAIKAGGLSVGLIIMVGIGGQDYAAAHFAATVELIHSLPLTKDDLVYLSPFVPSDDSPYVDDARQAGLTPLDDDAIAAEEARFKAALLPWAKAIGVRISHYDVREFIY